MIQINHPYRHYKTTYLTAFNFTLFIVFKASNFNHFMDIFAWRTHLIRVLQCFHFQGHVNLDLRLKILRSFIKQELHIFLFCENGKKNSVGGGIQGGVYIKLSITLHHAHIFYLINFNWSNWVIDVMFKLINNKMKFFFFIIIIIIFIWWIINFIIIE